MLSVIYKLYMLSVIMLNVDMLSVVMLNVVAPLPSLEFHTNSQGFQSEAPNGTHCKVLRWKHLAVTNALAYNNTGLITVTASSPVRVKVKEQEAVFDLQWSYFHSSSHYSQARTLNHSRPNVIKPFRAATYIRLQ